MAIFRDKICSLWPKWYWLYPPVRYCGALIQFHRCTGPLATKNGRKLKNMQKSDISGPICKDRCTWQMLKFDPKARFWCSLSLQRGFGICQDVSKCLLMFLRHLKGSKMKSSKKRHFSAPFPYWKAPYLKMKSAGIRHLLFGGFNAFSSPIG